MVRCGTQGQFYSVGGVGGGIWREAAAALGEEAPGSPLSQEEGWVGVGHFCACAVLLLSVLRHD